MQSLASLPVARVSAMAAGGNAARLTAQDLNSQLRKAAYDNYLRPAGPKPTEFGARRWDFANVDAKQAVECKSGQVVPAELNMQFEFDKNMVLNRQWSIRYFSKEPLNPNQMAQLRQLEVDSNGDFTVVLGG